MTSYRRTSELYKRLLSYVWPFKTVLIFGIVANVLYSGVDASFTYMIKPAMDKSFFEKDMHFVYQLPWIICLGVIFRGFISGAAGYCMTWVSRQVVMVLRQQVFKHIVALPVNVYDKSASGQLLSKLLFDVEQVAQVSADALTTFVQSSCLLMGLLAVMFIVSWQLSLLFLLTAPLIALIVSYTNKKTRKVSHAVQESMGNVTEIAAEAIEGYQVVRVFGGQQREKTRFNQATETSRKRDMKVAKIKFINVAGVQLVIGIGILLIISFAIYLSNTVDVGGGGFVAILAAMLQLIKPMKDLSTVNSTIQRGLAGAESIFNLFDMPLEKDLQTGQRPNGKGDISFKNVCFSYDESHPVFNKLNLHIPAGKTIALVGKSGSGKTTIANLLPRFYDIDAGEVSIDNVSINKMTLTDLRSLFAMVSQQVVLFNDTIAANIAYGKPDATIEAIHIASKRSFAYDFIQSLPNGFDTKIGENGVLLSGGQRQRIAIARAILKDASILIMDEATSALDNESERYIQQALDDIKVGRTTLIIAHRLSTIEKADQIIVLDNGRIVEQGQHQQLLAKQGYYARLYESQFHQFDDHSILVNQ